jgi:hypothetical protein
MLEYKGKMLDYFKIVGIGGTGCQSKNAPILAASFLAYLNGVDSEILINFRMTMANDEYIYEGYDKYQFLPAVRLSKAIRGMCFKSRKDRYNAFLRAMFAIYCIAENKQSRAHNRPIDEIVYDISYAGKTLSKCHENKILNDTYKAS